MIAYPGMISGEPAIIAEKANGGNEIAANLRKVPVIFRPSRGPRHGEIVFVDKLFIN